MLARQLVQLALQLIDLGPQRRHSLIPVLFDFIDADDLSFESLRLLEQFLVHFLDLIALHLVLLLQG